MSNGIKIDRIEVMGVWEDSLLMGSSRKAIKFSEIAQIRKLETDPALNLFLIFSPIVILLLNAYKWNPFE